MYKHTSWIPKYQDIIHYFTSKNSKTPTSPKANYHASPYAFPHVSPMDVNIVYQHANIPSIISSTKPDSAIV